MKITLMNLTSDQLQGREKLAIIFYNKFRRVKNE
jgi:hypothetical protein